MIEKVDEESIERLLGNREDLVDRDYDFVMVLNINSIR